MFGGQLPVQVRVAVDANNDSAVAVDLLVVYDDKVLTELLKTPAADWFANKKQLMADHPDGISVQSWEWVPGQPVDPVTIEYRSGARRIVLFADYNTDGPHRAALAPQQPFRLTLGKEDLKVEAVQ
jgi:type VI secretion system protein